MYRIFDFLIESNIPLPELPEVDKGAPSISFHCSSKSPSANGEPSWFHHWRLPDGEITISCAMAGRDYYLRFPQLADFLISEKGDDIRCFPFAGVPDGTVRHLLLDQVVPRVVGHQGRVVLHASAVRLEQGGVAFMGETGWGKSTMAASFHQDGCELSTDDCLLLVVKKGKIIGIPSYKGTRLWSDSLDAVIKKKPGLRRMAHYSAKERVIFPVNTGQARHFPVAAVFLLGDPENGQGSKGITIRPVRGARALIELIKSNFQLDVFGHDQLRKRFYQLGYMVELGLPVFCLLYPREHRMLGAVRRAVKAILESLDPFHVSA